MTALGHERTSPHVRFMSALPPKTDIDLEVYSSAPSIAELRPDLVAEAKRPHRKRPKCGQLSLRAVAAELAKRGSFQ
jgi:hypothetical protein